MTNLDELLRFDGIAEAEKITGQSYKEDEGTMGLGFLLLQAASERKREVLAAAKDSHYGITFTDYVDLFKQDGFEVVREKKFAGSDGIEETHVILWKANEGILATAESYRANTLNSSNVHYNVEFDADKVETGEVEPWDLISSGGFNKEAYDEGKRVWIGHHDGREGIRYKLARLRSAGTFQPVWTERPYLSLLTYQDWRTISTNFKDADALRDKIIADLPESVRNAITPAK